MNAGNGSLKHFKETETIDTGNTASEQNCIIFIATLLYGSDAGLCNMISAQVKPYLICNPTNRTMKGFITSVIITIAFCGSMYAQKQELAAVIDTTLQVMKANSVNKNTVNWTRLREKALAEAKNAENGYQLGNVFRMILRETNDFHGSIFVGDSTFKWSRGERTLSDSIKNEWTKGVYLQSKLLPGHVGYLRVPYMSFDKQVALNAKAQALNDSLCSLLSQNVKGIVLDLRLNGGGAMFPMLLGLEQLLGDGEIGSFTSGGAVRWLLKDNSFYLDTMLMTSIIPKCSINAQTIPVAVIIGPATGSSGEFLAMGFKGRKNTVFIGTKTAGYITTTRGFNINDAVSILISTGYGKDRNGHVYKEALSPDITLTDEDSFNDIEHDKKVVKGCGWIEAQR